MNKDKLWIIITDKNPKCLTNDNNLTANGLKKLFDTAYDNGFKSGANLNQDNKPQREEEPFGAIFSELFKGRV